MSVTASKTKAESAMTYTLTEITIIPGDNEVTVIGTSNDPDVKRIHALKDVQNKVDNMDDADLDGYNNFFRRVFADALGIDPSAVTGEVFSKSSSGA